MALRVNADNFESEVLDAKGHILVDFYSDTCVPCKKMSATLSKIEDDLGGKVKITKVNINYDLVLAEKYDVLSAPTLLLFLDGDIVERLTGAISEVQLMEKLESLIN